MWLQENVCNYIVLYILDTYPGDFNKLQYINKRFNLVVRQLYPRFIYRHFRVQRWIHLPAETSPNGCKSSKLVYRWVPELYQCMINNLRKMMRCDCDLHRSNNYNMYELNNCNMYQHQYLPLKIIIGNPMHTYGMHIISDIVIIFGKYKLDLIYREKWTWIKSTKYNANTCAVIQLIKKHLPDIWAAIT
jgi:hypothetical protein